MVLFLLVSPRHGADIAAQEYRDFLGATGLKPEQLDQVQMDSEQVSLPADLNKYAGIFVGGSPFNVSDPEYSAEQLHVHAQLTQLVASNIPVMFVCFGNAFCAHLTGGTVSRTYAEDSGPTQVELTAAGQLDPLTKHLPAQFTALTGHTEATEKIAGDCVLLATGPTCPVQIVRVNATTWSCQFHAEMDPAAMKARMDFYFDYGYFSPADYDQIVALLPAIDTQAANSLLARFVEYCSALAPENI